jgi:putative aldouronate transport system substrate-binding protein
MLKFKKLTLCVAAICMMALIFASCSGITAPTTGTTADNTQSTTASTNATSAVNKPEEKPVKLTWYFYLDALMPDQQLVNDKLNEYLLEKINATVEMNTMKLSDYETKMPVIISSGQNFDICYAKAFNAAVSYQNEAATGSLYELTPELLQTYAPESLEVIPSRLWDMAKYNGKIYGFPMQKEEGQQIGYMVNADMAKEYGLDYSNVKSWKDIEPLLEALHQKAPDIIGLYPTQVWFAASYAIEIGDIGLLKMPGDTTFFPSQQEGKVFNQYATPEFKEFCEIMHSWYEKGYLPDNPLTYKNRSADDKAGKLFAWKTAYSPNYENTYSTTVGHTEDYIPLTPVRYKGTSNFQVISAASKNPTRAIQFLNLCQSDITVGNLLRHGIEGTHYTKVGNQVHVEGNAYYYNFGWQFGCVFNQNWVDDYPENIAEVYREYNAACEDNPLAGFAFNNNNVKNQAAAINSVLAQYVNPLTMGVMDPDESIPEFLDALEKNGINELLAEEQRQVDEYLANR